MLYIKMNLQDLLLGIDGGGNVSVRGTMMEDDHEDSVSEEEDEEDEEEDDEDEYAGRGQVLKYKESQKPMENIKLAFVVQDLPPPSPKNKKTPSSSCDSQGLLFFGFSSSLFILLITLLIILWYAYTARLNLAVLIVSLLIILFRSGEKVPLSVLWREIWHQLYGKTSIFLISRLFFNPFIYILLIIFNYCY